MKITATRNDFCHECNRHGHGVQFSINDDRTTEAFLCWEHFRLNTEVLLEAGIVRRRYDLILPHHREEIQWTGRIQSRTEWRGSSDGIHAGGSESTGISVHHSRTVSEGESESQG